jgi:hypothetical protein
MARTVIGLLLVAAFIAGTIYVALDQNRVECEVCMSYRGRQICEKSSAMNRQDALMQATSSACAQLSSGVTNGIQCTNSPPASSQCSD